jgi:phytoene/squalene synthetase
MLPAGGREGDPPPWPLHEDPHELEQALWAQLWATPQAVAWQRHGWTRVVARYVRVALVAESLNKDAMSEARQLEDRLGLTPKAMQMLMWQIARDEVAERRQDVQQAGTSDARERFKAVG